ncbi:Uncharacterised protein (plasmid) [Tsukamurella tyrosinosolvens]|uniref:Uncharacterized protein n=1 Tax=Tsukamurella tyrosinosolvens TaxID=57704 RepID=A0A1H4UJP3_TSUTY|nr:DUF6283 family protein [Tsukamurella tyrosinosolvens]KXO93741.1 hypothetical protein AXK58_13645 [Tsukamurella tyrosinosolvens]SEC68334.1 hypothetical protein SAMN04489793_2909 [Tsukamurella tyrosinosolvens]VEH94239.1 Uncharacterised protein [Tsukamurella tyrosinosolvens]
MSSSIDGPAPRPCESCPYRSDVPSGIWSPGDYAKLERYDAETYDQPQAVFRCHQLGVEDPRARMCAGWVGCHGWELLALRLWAGDQNPRTDDQLTAVIEYRSPVPLFATGGEAAAHGMRDIENPSPEAVALIEKVTRLRPEVQQD